METGKNDKKNNTMTDSFFCCCPICRQPLVQAKNGMDGVIKCPKCTNYIHIVIKDDAVIIKKNYTVED